MLMGRKKKDTGLGRNDTPIDTRIANCPFKVDEKVLASPKITGYKKEWLEYTVGAIDITPKSGLVIAAYDSDARVVMGGVQDFKKV